MIRFLFTPQRVLAILAVLLAVNALLPKQAGLQAGYLPRSAVNMITQPLTAPLASLASSLRGGAYDPVMVGSPHQLGMKYGQALVMIHRLEDKLDAAHKQIAMLSQSRKIALSGVSLLQGRVTGYSESRAKPTLSISRGRNDGVVDGAVVVSGFSLVGRVDKAYVNSADVDLILAPQTKLQVQIIPPTPDAQPRETMEMIQTAKDGQSFTVQVTRDADIKVGDLAHLADDRWPVEAHGFIVGKVSSVVKDPEDPLRFEIVTLKPMIPLRSLSRATVLVPVEN